MCDPISQMIQRQSDKNDAGTLTVGEALIGNYYRILEGKYAGRVIIKARDRIDDEEIVRFANGLTWIYMSKLKDVRCEGARPSFNAPNHTVDYSQATWYPDGSDKPMHHEW